MKHFLIRYRFTTGSEAEWHRHIARFIAALDSDPATKGKIAYRCLKLRDGADYFHLATAEDDAAVKAMQSQAFFKAYSEQTRTVAGGQVEVSPLELVAETALRA